MSTRLFHLAVYLILATGIASSTGCGWCMTLGPNLGIFAVPIPVSPYYQTKKEQEFWNHERYERSPILGPITAGVEPVGLDPPSDDEVMQALERARPIQGGLGRINIIKIIGA